MKLRAWLFFVGASIILHMFGLSLYVSFQDKITPSIEGYTSKLEIVSDTELSLLKKWSTPPSLNSNSQLLAPQANNDHPTVQWPNANSKLIYQKSPYQLKVPITKTNSIPKIIKNNRPVSDLNFTVRKPISPTAMKNYDKAYIAIHTLTEIHEPETLKSYTKEDIYRQSYEPKTADLPQIDIYKDLLNYETNNPKYLLPKKTSQIDRKPDPKINNSDQTQFSSLQVADQKPIIEFTNQSTQIHNNNSKIDDDISREWGFKIIKALQRAVENPIGVRGEASVSMELTISKNGDLLNVKIIKSSGNVRFAKAAQRATKLANYPRAPSSFTQEKKTFKIKLIL